MNMKKLLFSLLIMSTGLSIQAQENAYFTNPVIPSDVADPSLIRVGNDYYATGTSSEWAPHYPIFHSTDLVNWKQTGHVFEEKPSWIKNSFWAPEWFAYKGKYYVYYTARKASDNISCVGVAVADKPNGPFKDHGPIVEFGKEAIDAFILEDKGKLYISWKAYGLDDRPIELLACQLSADGLRLDGEHFSLICDDEHQGLEGQHWFKHNGYYYLIYSIKGCCGPNSDYAVSVARSKSLKGPYEKYTANPILHGSQDVMSIGHGTFATTPEGRMYFLCHAYLSGAGFYRGRQPFLLEMKMGEDGWPHFVTGEHAALSQPMPLAGTVQKPVKDFYDDFSSGKLRHEWTWNYPYSDVKTSLGSGFLSLSNAPKEGTKTGAALCLRPSSSNYSLETAIINHNDQWKGIVLYGDHENLITLGRAGNQLLVKQIQNGKETILYKERIRSAHTHLRMEVTDGKNCSFAWSADGKNWNPIYMNGTRQKDVKALVRWDRISRPGLYQEGGADAPAHYAYCLMKNR